MRKLLGVFLLFIIVFAVSGCSQEANQTLLNLKDDYFLYGFNSINWYVDTDGTIYYISQKPTGEMITYYSNNEKFEVEQTIDMLYTVDPLGNQTEIFAFDSINIGPNFIIKDNVVYYTVVTTDITTNKDLIKLSSINILNKESKNIGYLGEFETIKRMELIGDTLFYLGIQKGYKVEHMRSSSEIPYSYQGELIGSIDLATGIATTLDIKNPVAFAKTTEDNLMIYAHDDKGYYFIEYDIPTATFANKSVYHNLGRIYEFEIYNRNNDFIYNSNNLVNECLSASSVDENAGIIEMMPNVVLGDDNCIEIVGGYAYVYNVLIHKVERIKIDTYINSNTTINLIQSEYIEEAPFGCGYNINRTQLEEESFALKILSQDKDYDVCLLSSRQDISQRIQNYGSFYPLNKVEGVNEYLDACFPSLKEAATTENGDVWMIPIAFNVPLIFYNTDACMEAGIDPSAVKDLDTLIHMLDVLNGKDKTSLYSASGYVLTEHLLQQYLRVNDSFKTDSFQELAVMLKEQVNYRLNEEFWYTNGEVVQSFILGKITNQLFTDSPYYRSQSLIANRNPMIEARSFPYITENQSNIATCVFLAVNPESKNLKSTLRYITALCDYLLTHNQSMVLHDRTLYPMTPVYDDIYDIYQNGSVYFQLPSDILMEDYHDYLENKIDLDTLLREAERKLSIYKNE